MQSRCSILFLISAIALAGCDTSQRVTTQLIRGVWVTRAGKGWGGTAIKFDRNRYLLWTYSDIPVVKNMFDETPDLPWEGTYAVHGNAVVLHFPHGLRECVYFLGEFEGKPHLYPSTEWSQARSGADYDSANLLFRDMQFDPADPLAHQAEGPYLTDSPEGD